MKPLEGRPEGGHYEIEPERYEFSEHPRYTFEIERRDFMRVFGAGLVVVATLPRAFAQESGRGQQGRGDTAELAAWLHIDEHGHVTVYTGKVEIGQNIRTSLAQTVAEELRVPMTSISMVMADTGLVPFDAGTFGSQSTPRMGRQLSRAAAMAREMLIDAAAAKLQVDRSTLTARDGRIAGAGASLTYGDLTKGQKLTGSITGEPPLTPADKWTVRGSAPRKIDGRAFVTGQHAYTPDVVRPGMVFGRVIRPETIGATLESVDAVDTTKAAALPGVSVVRDGEFVGLVAPTERAAKRAEASVHSTWKPLAGQPSSKTIYEHLQKTSDGGRAGGPPYVSGDAAAARAGAAKTFDATYRIPYIAHVPLEPRAAVAEWSDGRLTVWTGTQRPFGVRTELAEAFHLPEDRVRVIVPDMGSGYGGKHTGEVAIEAARLARAAGKPVKLVWTRAEEFTWAYFRPAGVIDAKAAVDATGRLIAWEFDNWNSGNAGIRTPYDIPNQRIQYRQSNSPLRQGSYRGLAATANHYVREMHMDAVARALGVDAVEFRLQHLKDERMRAVLQAVAGKIGWPKPSAAGRSLGIACGTEKGSYIATAAELSKTPQGFTIERIVAAFECGAIVNPDGLRNQVEGSIVQGLGGALFEAIDFADGRILNGTMEQYRVPRFKDVPPIEIVLLDRKDLQPAGAGETPIVCVAPAIGSAARAFGRVDTALPITLL
jgi:CO/xanthine dehydrogenase Mo-binding subunit